MNPPTPQQIADIAESIKAIPSTAFGVAAWKRAILYNRDHPGRFLHKPYDPAITAAILKQLRDHRAQNGGLAGEQNDNL